jgi:hypothetical protein
MGSTPRSNIIGWTASGSAPGHCRLNLLRSPRTGPTSIRKTLLGDLSGISREDWAGSEHATDALHELCGVSQVVGVDLEDVLPVRLEPGATSHVRTTLRLITVVLALILDRHLASWNGPGRCGSGNRRSWSPEG